MREALSKRSKVSAKTTAKGKLSASQAQAKLTKPKSKATSKPKALSDSKTKSQKSVKPKAAALKSVKAIQKTAATKKAVTKLTKPGQKSVPKVVAKKPAPKVTVSKKATKQVASSPKQITKDSKVTSVANKTIPTVRKAAPKADVEKAAPRKINKIVLPIRVAPSAPPAEPPRRSSTTAALKAFEHAVRAFNRRHFEEAKEMLETLQAKYPNEVEIIARSQMYLQVCAQKLANMPSAPRNADELYDRGVYALNIGDFSQAKNFFEKALRLKPEEPHLLYSLAATLAQTGSHDQALDYLKRTIQIQPRYRAQALNDSDFSELRENKQFLEMLGLASPFDILQARR